MSTHNIPFLIQKKENHPKLSQICSHGIFSKGLKNELETAVVNKPSMFKPLKFYYIPNYFKKKVSNYHTKAHLHNIWHVDTSNSNSSFGFNGCNKDILSFYRTLICLIG